jgi:APA family basic amino acid/polyamine antiporter
METLQKKYGLWTAIAMVVGIVIGSGVFFKADDVLVATNGNLGLAILAWIIGGLIMVVSAYTLSLVATKVSKVNGVVDYIEEGYGETAGYFVGWFMTFVYYPTLTGILAWISGLYTAGLLGLDGYAMWYIAFGYFVGAFALNYYSPVLSGKFQVSATVIKLIPIGLVAVVGGIAGLINGVTIENFKTSATVIGSGGGLATAVLATAFAYEGWIVATSINAELKDAKKTLPKALVIGTLVVVGAYILYYVGLSGIIENQVFIDEGNNAVNIAVEQLFGAFAGTALMVFVIISCLGTLNGLTLGASRGMYSLAIRGRGFKSKVFSEVNETTNAPGYSVLLGALLTFLWTIVWFGNFEGWFNGFMDTSELPIAMLYAIYVAIYIWIMRTFKDGNVFQRYIAPALSLLGSLYIIYAAVQKDMFLVFFGITVAILVFGYVSDKYLNE